MHTDEAHTKPCSTGTDHQDQLQGRDPALDTSPSRENPGEITVAGQLARMMEALR